MNRDVLEHMFNVVVYAEDSFFCVFINEMMKGVVRM